MTCLIFTGMKKIIYILAFSCITSSYAQNTLYIPSNIKHKNFESSLYGKDISLIKISNSKGMKVYVTNYGARIVSIMAADRNGNFEDVVCGFDSIADYQKIKQNFGALVGRYIGRILGAKFTLDGIEYKLQAGGNGHCAHGGTPGFADKVWNIVETNGNTVKLSYLSVDGENGFPGNLDISVTYTLSERNELIINYEATTDKPTVLNPSNHSFFNISGDLNKSITDQKLFVDGDSIAEYDNDKCVTGRMISVKNSPFDFRCMHHIGDNIDDDNQQLKVTGGYDHTWKLNSNGDIDKMAARIKDKKSGRVMEVYTTEPGLHIYTANGHNSKIIGKSGITYVRRNSICFETMHFADSPNKPQFPSTALRPGEKFTSTTIFRFRN